MDFKISDLPSIIQTFVLVMAGLFAIVHYTFKLSRKDARFERYLEGLKLLPSLAGILLVTVTLFVLTPIFGGFTFSSQSQIILSINIFLFFWESVFGHFGKIVNQSRPLFFPA